VSAFVKIFSVMNSSSEGTYSRCKPWAGFRSASCEFSDYWSMLVKYSGESSIVSYQERSKRCRGTGYETRRLQIT